MWNYILINIRNIYENHNSSMKILKLSDCLKISQAGDLTSTLYILQIRIRLDQNCIF